MKNSIGLMGVIILSVLTTSSKAQQTWEAKKNPTVDSLISPQEAKLIPPRPALTTEDIFPVIGKYESSANSDAPSVTITLDEQNKGVVWIEGLPQGKIKAMLRQSPATYKIPAQKTEEGKNIAEGTLIFDKDANTLSICIGKDYNAGNPTLAFVPVVPDVTTTVTKGKTAKTKIKTITAPKPWIYTGVKVEKATVMN